LKGYQDDGKNYHVIVGDFNAMTDFALDRHMRSHNSSTPDASRSYVNNNKSWLKGKGFMDTFRECYPLSCAYTWTNGTTLTRIDYI